MPTALSAYGLGTLSKLLRRDGQCVDWVQEVLDWEYGTRGLLVNGPTGVGKSRVMWLMLRRLLDKEHRRAVVLNAVTFRSGLQSAACDGVTAGFVRGLVRTDVLYWDDLGQMHLTGAASEMLLHLVEQRVSAGRPILVSTQYSGEELDAQFDRPEMGLAIRRRLNEFCQVVTVREVAGEVWARI